ncbi:hypothetical protein AA0311_1481 [Asaia bogorensis NBRC 16594]|uniref:Uncharacterized protein n=1 Tax=Asaia bogorensis NBRC 16594 TaxID=1231624 RepID=A0AAN4R4Q6_9PROT|nr:hypothetical protein Asbog_01552 [Asaia bogorensis NBRC 16594]GBQ77572.1 hypothetical protein AA0311_1481 [Asaia bogorensis NBRC 16594]GEL54332.1 hypothetical protein ABO01nite_23390 [Asaia bogorensis NBRC 16594]
MEDSVARIVVVEADDSVRDAIDNLLNDAIRFAGGALLSLEDGVDEVCIHGDDRGPGIPARFHA